MTYEQIDALLAARGYRRIEPPTWRSWLWVEPLRDDALPTKLCQWGSQLKPDGLHWLLDHYCELKSEYYTDEDRAENRRASVREVSA